MSNTISPRQNSSVKRRRILSDIINTGVQPPESHTRRKSLGFDLVRIQVDTETDTDTKTDIKTDTQPDPDIETQKHPVRMEKRGTNIPTLRNSEKYEKFLNISENLNRRCKVGSSVFSGSNSFGGHSSSIYTDQNTHNSTNSLSENNKQTIEKLESEIQKINIEIRLATNDVAAIDDEYSHQNMLYRALKTEMLELENVLRDHEAKFEYLLSQTTSKVELKQKELEVSLKEYRTKAENFYNDARFELENELRQVTEFDDTEALSHIELLKKEKARLNEQLLAQETANEEKLKELEGVLESKLKQLDMENNQKIKSATDCVMEKERELECLELDLAKAVEVLEAQKQSEAELEQKIHEQKQLLDNFDAVKEDWLEQLADIASKIQSQHAIEKTWAQNVEDAKCAYQKTKMKFDQYMKTIRSLDHALSCYGSARRVFVKVPEASVSGIEQDNCIYGLEFDKVVSCSDHSDFSIEWELHAQECLRGVLAGLIFCGSRTTNCLDQIKKALQFLFDGIESVKDRTHDLYIQSVHVDIEGGLVDLLNRLTSPTVNLKHEAIELTSQRMTLAALGDIDTAFKHINLANKTTVHLFTIVGSFREDAGQDKNLHKKGIKSQLCLIDLSQLSLNEQVQYMKGKGKSGELNLLLTHIYNNTKCLTISEIGKEVQKENQNETFKEEEGTEDGDIIRFLEALHDFIKNP